jgi:hypothetical protein
MSGIQPKNHVLETFLPLLFIHAALGNIILFPIAVTLLVAFTLVIIEALHIFNNTIQRLHEVEQERFEKARTHEIALITGRLSEESKAQAALKMALLKEELDLAEKRRSKEFANMAELIYNEGAVIQALVRKEEEKARRKAETVNVKTITEAKTEGIRDKSAVTRTENDRKAKTQRFGISSEDTKASKVLGVLPYWVNDLDPKSEDFTCIGTTEKGKRCHMRMISNECKDNAASRLEEMRSSNPRDVFLLPKLIELASWMLCPRWHATSEHRQVEDIAKVWYHELQDARDALIACKKIPSTPSPPYLRPTSSVSSSSSFRLSPRSSRQGSGSSIDSFASNISSPSSKPKEGILDYAGHKRSLSTPRSQNTEGNRAEKGRVLLTSKFKTLAANGKNQIGSA